MSERGRSCLAGARIEQGGRGQDPEIVIPIMPGDDYCQCPVQNVWPTFGRMAIYRRTINGLPLELERQNLTPHVQIFMVSVQGDPVQFPMIYKTEFGWFFVDKMTLVEFREIEQNISAAIQEIEAAEKARV